MQFKISLNNKSCIVTNHPNHPSFNIQNLGATIGEVKDLELKSLADIDDFEPAPLTSVLLVDYLMGGKYQVDFFLTLPSFMIVILSI